MWLFSTELFVFQSDVGLESRRCLQIHLRVSPAHVTHTMIWQVAPACRVMAARKPSLLAPTA